MDHHHELIAFCEQEHESLVGMLGLYLGDRAVAEELAQETLVRVWRHWRKVRGLDNPRAWTHRVALNLANSHFRRLAAERRARARMGHEPARGSVADSADAVAARAAIAALPPRQRTALILRYYLDLPFAEVADRMDAPVSTVRSLARRGIERLRSTSGLIEIEDEVVDVT